MKTIVLSLVLAVLPAVLLAQPNCTRLGFENTTPTQGADLARCARDEQQCCTGRYIQMVENTVREELQGYLVEEFVDVIEQYLDEVGNLMEYFDEDFIGTMFRQLPGAAFINTSDNTFGALRNELIENFEIPDEDQFGVRQFVDSLLDSLSDALEDRYEGASEDCISDVIQSQLNQDAISDMVMQLQEIRMSITTLQRIGTFLQRQLRALEQETILEVCVARFIELAFCSRCVRATPPLCLNTCNALLRACYSPYYTALNRQYDQLWRIVQRTVEVANSTVQRFLNGESVILDFSNVVGRIARECNVDLTVPGRSKREEDNAMDDETEEDTTGDDTTGDSDSTSRARDGNAAFIPFGLVDDIFELSGAFQYGRRGLLFCLNGLDDSESQMDNDRRCYREDICTARRNCWDGERGRTNDTESFDLNDIEDQDQNPVLVIEQQMLESVAQSLGEPVSAFLTSDEFTSVAPDSVQEDGSSCAGVVASIGIVLLAVLMTLMN